MPEDVFFQSDYVGQQDFVQGIVFLDTEYVETVKARHGRQGDGCGVENPQDVQDHCGHGAVRHTEKTDDAYCGGGQELERTGRMNCERCLGIVPRGRD